MNFASKKIVKEKGAALNEAEEQVAKALIEIETSPSNEIKSEVKDVVISSAKEIDGVKGQRVIIVHVPYRSWRTVVKIQSRLVRELEKKFTKKHIVLVANRTILDKNFRRKGYQVRPRSRTLTSVHESILEDIVGPTEIVGKRTHVSVEGTKTLKVFLNPKDREANEEKLGSYAAAYQKLTNKIAVFMFP
uniref:40S ribosomal protein S7 n=1 Tax=Noctiluca scintillans TaxID=2966 RepID=A0A7S1AY43_NOCSC|mmetsp:Transcript_65028/g.172163  ORF Transcript_65028/g.172163 Transcript_65028/m.172163 type:complete len:190 (+) Transcript_65028:78-647(+)|eukprot:CAMPEP_0194485358 /NCGR_PEP_ID=MMETSP0253-20130528/6393_1 /TAXON_ID=2966 /ORGANISM="Noctiluca scintillans" /LENGTH=189 /DNA_ID=CAMNT_0039325335 /DNA_START=55 /DNA_END=624 /DNA_ORIENTATION=-